MILDQDSARLRAGWACLGLALCSLLPGCKDAAEAQVVTQAQAAPGEPIRSTFNGLELDPDLAWDSYSFAVVGHIRGPDHTPSPNASIRADIGRLLATEPEFVLALGDLYVDTVGARMQEFRDWVEEEVDVPFFNAIGGHDSMPGFEGKAAYEAEFGARYFDFTLGSEMYLFLDFQESAHAMAAEQWAYFEDAVARAEGDEAIENVFVLSHKLIWSYHNPEMGAVFQYRHPLRIADDYDFYATRLRPALEPLAAQKNVYFLAGDIGGTPSHLQMFYQRDETFTYVATGMGPAPQRNNFVRVTVDAGEVSFEVHSLMTGEVTNIERYDLASWEEFYATHPENAAMAIPEYFYEKQRARQAAADD